MGTTGSTYSALVVRPVMDKIKRAPLINTIENGGLKMPDIESMIKAQRILCIEKFLDTNPAGWKCLLELYLKKSGRYLLNYFLKKN